VLVGRLIPAGTGLHSDAIYEAAAEVRYPEPHDEVEKAPGGTALQFEVFDGSADEPDEEEAEVEAVEGEPEIPEEELEEQD
jgi:hypothetical protein